MVMVILKLDEYLNQRNMGNGKMILQALKPCLQITIGML